MQRLQPHIEKVKTLHEQYHQYLHAAFFVLGFVFDIFTIGEIDDLSNIVMQIVYLISSIGILYLEYKDINVVESEKKYIKLFFEYREDIFHFLLGSLLSAFTLFYFKSSSLSNSFFFMAFLACLLLLNEFPQFQKLGLIVRTSLVMLCLLSFFIYIIPLIAGEIAPILFAISIFIGICFSIVSFIFLLKSDAENKDRWLKQLLYPHFVITNLFIILYLAKVFPPIPLSIKYIGIYHDVSKQAGDYKLSYNTSKWKFWSNGDQHFQARPNDKVYVFVKVFSPAGFSDKVYIKWMKQTKDGHKVSDRIPLSITGGKRGGFRGYAYKSNYTEGNWQVRVETEEGLEIGRINFDIELTSNQLDMKDIIM